MNKTMFTNVNSNFNLSDIRKNKSLLLTSLSGNFLEFYNFISFAYVSNEIVNNFFPLVEHKYQGLVFFSVFYIGYISRLLGSFIMGPIADLYGRKALLVTSIIMITISSLGICVMPSYEHIGLIAPVMISILRAVQGIAVSGEESSAVVFLVEVIGKPYKGFIGSLVLASAYLGMLFGSFTVLLISMFFTSSEIMEYAWRIPFLLSALLSLPVVYFRIYNIHEESREKSDTLTLYKKLFSKGSYKNMIWLVLFTGALAIPGCIFTTLLPSYLENYIGLTKKYASFLSTYSLLVTVIMFPIIGIICDLYNNYNRAFTLGCYLLVAIIAPVFLLLPYTSNLMMLMVLLTIYGLVLSLIAAPLYAILLNSFSDDCRCTGVSIAFNLGMSLLGGTAPFLSELLINSSNYSSSPVVLLVIAAILGLKAVKSHVST